MKKLTSLRIKTIERERECDIERERECDIEREPLDLWLLFVLTYLSLIF